MRVLYAIQATGNGHISRANEIIPWLEKMCDLDILVSGTESEIDLNHQITYRRKGLSFSFGKKGGIDFVKTFQSIKTKRFIEEVRSIPVDKYDLVINDFEPLSAWACKNRNIPCLALSHQFAVTGARSPKPAILDPFAWMVLKHYAPSVRGFGFHFEAYDEFTFTPVIRSDIRNAFVRNHGHYTVYLPAYSYKKLVKIFSCFPERQWHIFSKETKRNMSLDNCWIRPVNNYEFVSSFTTCEGIITGAGFETPAEALHMGKKLLVIPMKNQFEQHCNAAALQKMGVTTIKKLKKNKVGKIRKWINHTPPLKREYPNDLAMIMEKIFASFKTTTLTQLQKSGIPINQPEPVHHLSEGGM